MQAIILLLSAMATPAGAYLINFDTDADGNAIAPHTAINDQWASEGARFVDAWTYDTRSDDYVKAGDDEHVTPLSSPNSLAGSHYFYGTQQPYYGYDPRWGFTLDFVDPADPNDNSWGVDYLSLHYLEVTWPSGAGTWQTYNGNTLVGSGTVTTTGHDVSLVLTDGVRITHAKLSVGTVDPHNDGVYVDNITFDGLSAPPPSVPEPASLALLALATGGIGAMLGKRRR